MKRIALVLLVAVISTAGGMELEFQFTLDESALQYDTWMNKDVISIPGGTVPFEEGQPSLQGIPYTFVMPQGAYPAEVTVQVHGQVALEGRYNPAPVTFNAFSLPFSPASPSSDYFNSQPFPSDHVQNLCWGNRTGFRMGRFVFVPFAYNPMTGEMTLITSATLSVEYGPDPEADLVSLTERQSGTAASALESVVDNPEMLEVYAPEIRSDLDGEPVWVAIGTEDMESVLQPLVDHRNSVTGQSEFVSVEWITSNYTGYDTPEKIRNYLKDQFYNHSLVYALIVGDYGETTRISKLSNGSSTINNVTDHYYIDLDGTWDLDGDHQYGEAGDGIDYFSDLYVGRFCSDNAAHVQYMVDKTIAYETTAPSGDWRETAMLMGAGLWPPDYYGSIICNDIADLIPSGWTVEKLYETASSHPNNQIDIINDGCSYVTPQGHGNWAGIYWYDHSPTDMVTISNYADMNNIDRLSVFHSIACMAGELTEGACIAERLMLSPFGGAVAVMFNSSYGWGTPPYRGPSEWLEYTFAQQLFVYQNMEIGVTQAIAKDDIQGLTGVPLIGWVTQENNLLGDPALTFITGQTGIEDSPSLEPASPLLGPVTPNPGSGSFSVSYSMPVSERAEVSVYDAAGRVVRTLHSGTLQEGAGSLSLDGNGGAPLPAGCYSVILTSESGTASTRMVVIR